MTAKLFLGSIIIRVGVYTAPVVNLPVGFDSRGRPMGIQVMGPSCADKAVLEFALAYESATSFLAQRPTLVANAQTI